MAPSIDNDLQATALKLLHAQCACRSWETCVCECQATKGSQAAAAKAGKGNQAASLAPCERNLSFDSRCHAGVMGTYCMLVLLWSTVKNTVAVTGTSVLTSTTQPLVFPSLCRAKVAASSIWIE